MGPVHRLPSDPAARPQGCTSFKLRQLMRRVTQHYDLELAKAGLKTTQYSLLSHVLKRPRSWLLAHDNDAVTEADMKRFVTFAQSRGSREPVA